MKEWNAVEQADGMNPLIRGSDEYILIGYKKY